jgi:hypothetical protein
MLDTLRETLARLGVEPSGIGSSTREPSDILSDLARWIRAPDASFEASVVGAEGRRGVPQ